MPIDSIEKAVYYPASGLVIKHIVRIGNVDKKTKKRNNGAVINEYKTSKYSDCTKVSTLYLTSSDYIAFEYIGQDKVQGEKNAVFVSYPHIERLKRSLDEAFKWFSDEEYDDMFKEKSNGNLILNKSYADEEIFIDSLANNSWLAIKPQVVLIGDDQYEGVLLYINSEIKIIEMSYQQLLALIDFFKCFDLYQSSLQLQMLATLKDK